MSKLCDASGRQLHPPFRRIIDPRRLHHSCFLVIFTFLALFPSFCVVFTAGI